MAVRSQLSAICLCDGYGGFELGLREHGVRTVCRVERDSHAAAVLVARMEEQRLSQPLMAQRGAR
jgi:site-specific DNA-cytosine methylase